MENGNIRAITNQESINMISQNMNVIVALDLDTQSQAISLINQLPEVTFWKVGLELFTAVGGEILQYLKQLDKKIFLDLKFHDIPNTVAKAVKAATKYQVDILTIHITSGRKALQSAVQVVQEQANLTGITPPKLIGITLLTSLNARDLAFDLKIPLELPEYTLQMALIAQESGLDGVVCSPLEVAQIRSVCGDDFLLICPGVRFDQNQLGDQQRTLTPKQALNLGADYLVIGRPITQASNPSLVWSQLCQELSI